MAIVLVAPVVLARAGLAQEISLGIMAGVSRATLGGRDAGNFDPRVGFSAGGVASLRLTGALAVQVAALYTQKGGDAEAVEGTGSIHLTYVQLPVLVTIRLPQLRARAIRSHLIAGPAVSLRLACVLDAQVGETKKKYDCDASLFGGEIATKRFDYGLVLGGGAAVSSGRGELALDGRYEFALSSIDDGPVGNDVRNRAFSFLVGYSIPLGHRRLRKQIRYGTVSSAWRRDAHSACSVSSFGRDCSMTEEA